MNFSFTVLPSERVSSIGMKVSVSIWSSSVTVVDHILMATLPGERDEVPEVVWIFHAASWISFTGVSQINKFYSVFYPEYGSGVTDEVPITLLSIEFDAKTYILY